MTYTLTVLKDMSSSSSSSSNSSHPGSPGSKNLKFWKSSGWTSAWASFKKAWMIDNGVDTKLTWHRKGKVIFAPDKISKHKQRVDDNC